MASPQMRPADRITTHNGRVPAVASGARCFCIIVRVPTAAGRRTLQGGLGSRKTNPLHLARVFLRSGMTFAYVWVLMPGCLCLRAYVWDAYVRDAYVTDASCLRHVMPRGLRRAGLSPRACLTHACVASGDRLRVAISCRRHELPALDLDDGAIGIGKAAANQRDAPGWPGDQVEIVARQRLVPIAAAERGGRHAHDRDRGAGQGGLQHQAVAVVVPVDHELGALVME